MVDPKIKPDFLAKLKMYCEAFYTGLTVDYMYPPKTQGSYFDSLGVTSRKGYYSKQYMTGPILKKTIP